MGLYILKRLLLMIPTLIGILLVNFIILQLVPGGPVANFISRIEQSEGNNIFGNGGVASTRAGEDLVMDKATMLKIEAFKEEFGLNDPLPVRFVQMIGNYARFDFGKSMTKTDDVSTLIKQRIPVSIALGLWSTILIYVISIPLGIAKAVRDGTRFDFITSTIFIIAYALPSIILPVILRMYFAGGAEWGIFPLRGLVSDNFDTLSLSGKIKDYFWHITLPVLSITLSGFATKTMLTKNSFLDELSKQYVITARAKGLGTRRVLYGHVFRNAMLIVISGFPAIFLAVFFTGAFIVETTFSLNGLGLLGMQAVIERDYPVILGTLYIFSLFGLFVHLLADLSYTLVDPRIDFEAR